MRTRPDYKLRAKRAIEHLQRGVIIAARDHHREEGIIFFDFGGLENCVKMALEALEDPKAGS